MFKCARTAGESQPSVLEYLRSTLQEHMEKLFVLAGLVAVAHEGPEQLEYVAVQLAGAHFVFDGQDRLARGQDSP